MSKNTISDVGISSLFQIDAREFHLWAEDVAGGGGEAGAGAPGEAQEGGGGAEGEEKGSLAQPTDSYIQQFLRLQCVLPV